MRICLIGCVELSAKALDYTLELAAEDECEVVGVITKSASSFNADFVDLGEVVNKTAAKAPVHYYHDESSGDSFARETEADIVYCFGWSHLLRHPLLDSAPKGVIGFHPAALPANRGRHPIIWALILGLSETASTFFQMDERADSGPIVSQQRVPIASDDNAESLYEKLIHVALPQIRQFTLGLNQGSLQPTPQDHSQANYWRKRSPQGGIIDWRMQATDIHNLVRGLSRPYPGADVKSLTGGTFKVWRGSPDAGEHPLNFEPGKILGRQGSQVLVKCAGTSAIWLTEHEIPEAHAKSSYL